MVFKVDMDARQFEFWSGAKETINALREYDEVHNTDLEDQLYDELDEIFSDEDNMMTDTAINDYVWFDVPEMDQYAVAFGD